MNGSILTIIAISSLTMGSALVNGTSTETNAERVANNTTSSENNLRRGSKPELSVERSTEAMTASTGRRGTRPELAPVTNDPATGSMIPRRGSRDADQG